MSTHTWTQEKDALIALLVAACRAAIEDLEEALGDVDCEVGPEIFPLSAHPYSATITKLREALAAAGETA